MAAPLATDHRSFCELVLVERSCLGTFQHTARIGDVCHKPDIKFTIEPDRALADRLNPTRDDWQQIYQLLKAQKNHHPIG